MKILLFGCFLMFSVLGLYGQSFKTINDLSYFGTDEADEKHKLDLYLPEGIEQPPLLIWIHGGAWAFGNRKNEKALATKFAGEGIAVAVISYRLSPGAWADPKLDKGIQHPEHIIDVARAFGWLHKNAETYGFSQQDIFVSGYSAGGHLSALLATDLHYLKDQGLNKEVIKGLIPIAGAYDISAYHDTHYRYNGPEMAEKHVKAVFGHSEEDFLSASPTNFVNNLSVPMLLISENQSYDYTLLFEEAIKKAGKRNVDYLHVRELDHSGLYQQLAGSETSKYRDQIVNFILKWSTKRP
ncbi:MAG: alpha/beta hydrolase [Roseivirga sp.]|nr:alpha/beta hydrolase [Roseivirga sp.]